MEYETKANNRALRAEQEADQVASKFINSRDVVGDMSRAYGVDLGKISLHNDAEAHSKASSQDAVAYTSGNDIFFGKGILDNPTPENNFTVAHELAHTMQQSGQGGMTETASFGEMQFKKKKEYGFGNWLKSGFSRFLDSMNLWKRGQNAKRLSQVPATAGGTLTRTSKSGWLKRFFGFERSSSIANRGSDEYLNDVNSLSSYSRSNDDEREEEEDDIY